MKNQQFQRFIAAIVFAPMAALTIWLLSAAFLTPVQASEATNAMTSAAGPNMAPKCSAKTDPVLALYAVSRISGGQDFHSFVLCRPQAPLSQSEIDSLRIGLATVYQTSPKFVEIISLVDFSNGFSKRKTLYEKN